MGGPGSGGYKNAPGDIETHAAWDIIQPDSDSTQKLAQVRCKYCNKEMAQHTSRQRHHLLLCTPYLNAMKDQGIDNTITRQAADPAGFFRNSKTLQAFNEPKTPKTLKMYEHTTAVRIQALSLAEASIAAERIHEITGIDPKTLAGLRRVARERGYDPTISMQMKEEYVEDPPNTKGPRGRPKKRKADDELDPSLVTTPPNTRAPPGYVAADSLPPGNWNFMAPAQGTYGLS